MGILLSLFLILFTCLIIWRACDGFETASEYIGRNLSEGVRGGTINAISSSLPELLTTLIALFVLDHTGAFAVGIGTTAGSALFNGMIIPAACILTVVGTVVLGVRVTTVNVSTKVVLRDGLSLIFCEFVLILIITGTTLYWWQGLVLMVLYLAYLAFMLLSMKRRERGPGEGFEPEEDVPDPEEYGSRLGRVLYWISLGPVLDLNRWFAGEEARARMRAENWNGWPLLAVSVGVIAVACYLLVVACEWLGSGAEGFHFWGMSLPGGFGMPTMFVAVIFASMATSVPDTVISIRDARDGDYDDAVANALGSNIFDICFALGFPLFLYTLLHGPIRMSQEVADQGAQLRVLLLGLTVLGFLVYYLGRRDRSESGATCVRMGRSKALMLLAIYGSFVVYIVARSLEAGWALHLTDLLQGLIDRFPF